jgi:hypothetical protein
MLKHYNINEKCDDTITLTVLFLVGGIYTVIRSKASASVEEQGDHYILLGPYKEHCAKQEVETFELPPGTPLANAVQKLRDRGFKVTSILSTIELQFIVFFTILI